MTPPTSTPSATLAPSPSPAATAGPTTRVVLEREIDPFRRLSPEARRRLIVRVLCGLVAYEPAVDEPARAGRARLAG